MKSKAKSRLDCALVEKGIFESRQRAQRAILAGDIYVNGQRVDKPGTPVSSEALLEAKAHERYVSRGGYKLEAALAHFRRAAAGLDVRRRGRIHRRLYRLPPAARRGQGLRL